MFELVTLGGLALTCDGRPSDRATIQRRQLAFLAALATAGPGGMTRDKLAGLVWPERTTESARGLIDQALYAARRTCGADVIVATATSLAVNPAVLSSDHAAFTAAIAAGDAAAAVNRYGGPFLDGVFLTESKEFERWMSEERDRLSRLYREALETLARDAAARGDADAAVDWWRRIVKADPLNGHGARGLLTALAVAGNRVAALEFARVHEALVREEFGTAPDPAVVAVVDAIRAGELVNADGAEHDGRGGMPSSTTTAASAPDDASAPPPEPSAGAPSPEPAVPSAVPLAVPLAVPPAVVGRAPRPAWRRAMWRAALLAAVLVVAGAGVAAWLRARGRPPAAVAASPGSVAVLPFENISAGDGASNDYFSDGLTEELTSTLSRRGGVLVVARTSAFAFKDRAMDVREIARLLGVTHIVEGTVRLAGGRLRVTVQLVDARTGYQLWSDRYDRVVNDVFALEDEVAEAIVRALTPHLASRAAPGPRRSPDLPTYDLYLRARYALRRRTAESLAEAASLFQQAIARDSLYADAYAGLSATYVVLPLYGSVSYADAYETASRAAARALALDSTRAEALATLGLVRQRRYDWAGAEAAYRSAIARDSGSAIAHQWYGKALTQLGRFDEAERALRRAIALEPVSGVIRYNLAQAYFAARRYDDAANALTTALAAAPTFRAAHTTLGYVRIAQGRLGEALDEFTAAAVDPARTADDLAVLAFGQATAGRPDSARALLAQVLRARARDPHVSASDIAIVYMALGERDAAFEWLERGRIEFDSDLQAFATSPVLDPLRSDPRMAALRSRMRLPAPTDPRATHGTPPPPRGSGR